MGGSEIVRSGTSRHLLYSIIILVTLPSCAQLGPTLGGGGTFASGSAGGATSVDANKSLERCDSPLGTLAIVEDLDHSWLGYYSRATGRRSTVPALKLIIQQSNCFQVVSRSHGSRRARSRERRFADSGEARGGSNMGKGLLKVADYSMETSVLFSDSSVGKLVTGLGGLLGSRTVGGLAGGLDQKHTTVNLLLTDTRSTQQVAASEGSSSTTDIGAALGAFGRLFGGAGGLTRTPEGKALVAAFTDAYNKMVVAVKNYSVQRDPTGMSGRGGRLSVD